MNIVWTHSPNAYQMKRIAVKDAMREMLPKGTDITVDPMNATITVAPSADDAGYLRNVITFGWNAEGNIGCGDWCSGSYTHDGTQWSGIHLPNLCPFWNHMQDGEDFSDVEVIASAWTAIVQANFSLL